MLDIDFKQPVYVVVDRLAIGPDMRSRLVDSAEICYREGHGECILEFVPETPDAAGERMLFNERFECKTCGTTFTRSRSRACFRSTIPMPRARCQGDLATRSTSILIW